MDWDSYECHICKLPHPLWNFKDKQINSYENNKHLKMSSMCGFLKLNAINSLANVTNQDV